MGREELNDATTRIRTFKGNALVEQAKSPERITAASIKTIPLGSNRNVDQKN